MLDLSVIVPVRNAEQMIEGCLTSILSASPKEVIVVDGLSRDRTVEIARRYPVKIVSDQGQGVAAARMVGARAASSPSVALIDVDIILPKGALEALFDEYQAGRYTALQAGLQSIAGDGYWGQALVHHHRHGRSKKWPGVMATIFRREKFLTYGLDQTFLSGEDIELRWRLVRAGERIGVSERTSVWHRYGDTFEFARDQWLADGRGLARMVGKYRARALPLLAIPAAGCARGIAQSLVRLEPRWVPYFACYLAYNYGAMAGQFVSSKTRNGRRAGSERQADILPGGALTGDER